MINQPYINNNNLKTSTYNNNKNPNYQVNVLGAEDYQDSENYRNNQNDSNPYEQNPQRKRSFHEINNNFFDYNQFSELEPPAQNMIQNDSPKPIQQKLNTPLQISMQPVKKPAIISFDDDADNNHPTPKQTIVESKPAQFYPNVARNSSRIQDNDDSFNSINPKRKISNNLNDLETNQSNHQIYPSQLKSNSNNSSDQNQNISIVEGSIGAGEFIDNPSSIHRGSIDSKRSFLDKNTSSTYQNQNGGPGYSGFRQQSIFGNFEENSYNHHKERARFSMMVTPYNEEADKKPMQTYLNAYIGIHGNMDSKTKLAMRNIWKASNLKIEQTSMEGKVNLRSPNLITDEIVPLIKQKNPLISKDDLLKNILVETLMCVHKELMSQTSMLIIIRVVSFLYVLIIQPFRILSVNQTLQNEEDTTMRNIYFFFQFLCLLLIFFNTYIEYSGVTQCLIKNFRISVYFSSAQLVFNVAAFGSGLIVTYVTTPLLLNLFTFVIMFIVNIIVIQFESQLYELVSKILNLLKANQNQHQVYN